MFICLRQDIKAPSFSLDVFFVPITFPSKAGRQKKHNHSKLKDIHSKPGLCVSPVCRRRRLRISYLQCFTAHSLSHPRTKNPIKSNSWGLCLYVFTLLLYIYIYILPVYAHAIILEINAHSIILEINAHVTILQVNAYLTNLHIYDH